MLARVILGKIVQHTFWQIKYWQISHASIHIPLQEYYWWIKYWQFYSKIANHQSLLFANISSCTVYGLYIFDAHFKRICYVQIKPYFKPGAYQPQANICLVS